VTPDPSGGPTALNALLRVVASIKLFARELRSEARPSGTALETLLRLAESLLADARHLAEVLGTAKGIDRIVPLLDKFDETGVRILRRAANSKTVTEASARTAIVRCQASAQVAEAKLLALLLPIRVTLEGASPPPSEYPLWGADRKLARRRHFVVRLDLVGYLNQLRALEVRLGSMDSERFLDVMKLFDEQITTLITPCILPSGCREEDVWLASNGDGAILSFPTAEAAHWFAECVHRIGHEGGQRIDGKIHELRFRIGISVGPLRERYPVSPLLLLSGWPLIESARLEQGGKEGAITISPQVFADLPAEIQRLYDPQGNRRPKRISGKPGEKKFPAYMWIVPRGRSAPA
jgi:hypothetical protein